jgi:hypothetical protein
MESIMLLGFLVALFVLLGLTIEELTNGVRVLMAGAVLLVTGWYLIF